MQVEVYTFIFKQLNAYKLGVPIGYQLRKKKNRLGLTWFLGTSNGKLETTLGTNGDTAFYSTGAIALCTTRYWKMEKKSWSQYISNNNNLHEHNVGVSYA